MNNIHPKKYRLAKKGVITGGNNNILSKSEIIEEIKRSNIEKEVFEPKEINFEEDSESSSDPGTLPFKLSQLPKKRLVFEDIEEVIKPTGRPIETKLHLGQLKLFYSELLFLSKHAKDGNKVLYVGAASGYHIAKLADLFPNLIFDLWDPNRFDIPYRKNIFKYNDFFRDETAESYKEEGNNVLFMCDIRTIEIRTFKKTMDIQGMDELIINDIESQKKWVEIINPIYAYLKFRLPFEVKTVPYLTGTIYLQPYAPMSTEARLMTNNYSDTKDYDCYEYKDMMAYFNFFIRFDNIEYKTMENIMVKYNLKMNWDNVYSMHLCDYYLRKIKNIHSSEEAGKLFMEILEYHQERYGKKYNIIFDKKIS